VVKLSPSDLQNLIMRRLREILKDYPLQTKGSIPLSENDMTPFKIFRQHLPESLYDETDYRDEKEKDKDIYPFVCVNLPGGDKESNNSEQIEPVALLIGVKNEDINSKGFSDMVEAVQVIMDDFNRCPFVDNLYRMQYPMSWKPYEEENTFPYFFAQISMTFEIETPKFTGGVEYV